MGFQLLEREAEAYAMEGKRWSFSLRREEIPNHVGFSDCQ